MKKMMTVAGIAISGVLLWLAIKETDFGEITAAFRHANAAFAVPLLVALAFFYYLKAVRWSDILSPTSKIGAGQLIPAIMSGAAGNNLLPAHMGELVRVYLLGREYRLSKAGLLATLVAERVFDIVSVLLLLSVALFFTDISPRLLTAVWFLLGVALAGSLLMFLMTRHAIRFLEFVDRHSGRLPHAIRGKVVALAGHVTGGFGALGERGLFYRIFMNSIVQWALMSGCIYFALQAFAIDVPYHAAIIVLAIIVAGLTLPTSPGFVGTIQYCFVLGLTPFGVDSSHALAVSIFYHTVLWFSVTGTGLYFLHKYRLSFAEIRVLEQQEALNDRATPTNEQT